VTATGMWGRDEAETLARSKPGTSRSTPFAAASRKSLGRGSEATVFGACAGEGSQRLVCRAASPQSSTMSRVSSS
jgi:hypothetical protein